jgi:hypothetical protein
LVLVLTFRFTGRLSHKGAFAVATPVLQISILCRWQPAIGRGIVGYGPVQQQPVHCLASASNQQANCLLANEELLCTAGCMYGMYCTVGVRMLHVLGAFMAMYAGSVSVFWSAPSCLSLHPLLLGAGACGRQAGA